ncbi:MAG: MerR family transcriptional regulator [Bryobacteraceae bacterium]|nr:MerR family transcriptional regulator [Bryobacteraceae bacterium]
MAMTVTQAARQCGLSRSTLLYYESIGLVRPPRRNTGRYRLYGEAEIATLRQICAYREAGLKIEHIRTILRQPDTDASSVLKRRLMELSGEIEQLRRHQRAILALLRQGNNIWRLRVITKDKWVSIMSSAGFSKDDMERWHQEFERSAPDEHQEFLEFLHIPAEEIRTIRQWSRGEVVAGFKE